MGIHIGDLFFSAELISMFFGILLGWGIAVLSFVSRRKRNGKVH